jgi:hypothetical protein
MCDSKQKCSYKHVSDFRRLRSYGHFLIPVHAVMWTAVAYRVRCQLTRSPSYRQSSVRISTLWRYLRNKGKVGCGERSSQPSGSLCCGRRWHFRKPALSTDQSKLKAISRS